MATPAPFLNIPPSNATVKVSLIDSTLKLVGASASMMWNPTIPGFDRVRCGCWSILIEHPPSGKKLLYDLGVRKDWAEKLPPAIGMKQYIEAGIIEELKVEKNVAEILTDGGVDLRDVEAVIWSHWHFDHTGDVASFPTSTKLVVGPGFKENFMPGYPIDPIAHTLESDFEGREVQEISFSSDDDSHETLEIGGFKAIDYFGDGSFYVLNSPGHAIAHLSALARTTPSPSSTFIHLLGDVAHHPAELRPSPFLSFPETLSPSPLPQLFPGSCPGHIFHSLLRNSSMKEPILEFVDPAAELPEETRGEKKYGLLWDEGELRESIGKSERMDAFGDRHENGEEGGRILSLLAHDWSLKGMLPEWPEELNGWKERGWREKVLWKFLEDFKGAVEEG